MSNFEFALVGTFIACFVMGIYAIGISKWHDRQDKKRAQKQAH